MYSGPGHCDLFAEAVRDRVVGPHRHVRGRSSGHAKHKHVRGRPIAQRHGQRQDHSIGHRGGEEDENGQQGQQVAVEAHEGAAEQRIVGQGEGQQHQARAPVAHHPDRQSGHDQDG